MFSNMLSGLKRFWTALGILTLASGMVCIFMPHPLSLALAQSSLSGGGQLGSIRACGTLAACGSTAPTNVKVIYGSAALVTGTPSTVTITGLPFTSSSSYNCTATENGSALATPLSISSYISGASFTISGAATDTDVVNYICAGT